MGKIFLFLILSLCIGQSSFAQEDEFMHPGIQSAQLSKGHIEFELTGIYGNFYNNSTSNRQSGLESQKQNITGLSPSILYGLFRGFNIGVRYQFLYIEEEYTELSNTFISKYTANSIGPQVRIKISGNRNKSEVYFQAGAMIPIDSYTSPDKITYSAHLISSFRWGYHWISSAQFSGILFPLYPAQMRPFNINASLFAGYLIKNNIMPFALVNYSSDFGGIKSDSHNSYNLLNYSTNLGAGLKYHIFRHIELSGFYFKSIQSKNGNKFNNFSFSVLMKF